MAANGDNDTKYSDMKNIRNFSPFFFLKIKKEFCLPFQESQ